MLSALPLQALLFCGPLAFAQSPFQPGYTPLAVKTPYLHGWIASDGGNPSPAHIWPNFFTTDRILGWNGMIRIDGRTLQWMGNDIKWTGNASELFTTTVTREITPTRSIFRLNTGAIQFNVTFLSPVEPDDYVRQSIPFSYMFVDGFAANDSRPYTVQVYSDVSAEWVARDDNANVTWNTTEKDTIIHHHVTQQKPLFMTENNDIAEDSVGYYATTKRSGLTWQTGADVDCRRRFADNGNLSGSSDTQFRTVSDQWPVFAFAIDLGSISPDSQPDPVVFALGIVRDPVITYATDTLSQNRSGYYWSAYPTIEEVISAFLTDFTDAEKRNSALDDKILTAASAVSPEYAGILSLVTRQIFASMDITIPSASSGQFNTSDVKVFMKDIVVSSRANPVEVIYGAFPAFLHLNSSLARLLLEPLLEFQSSTRYVNSYAAPDLGTTYPAVFGNVSDTRILGVENCGNMLIMAYAHAVKSGDGSLISRYYSTLQRWADFLIANSLHPQEFSTADDRSYPNMSNLALKGILGIFSMAKISEAVRASNNTYMDQATQLMRNWKQLAVTDNHIEAVYNVSTSWSLMYNLFPAIWLRTDLIEVDILNRQAQFYPQQNTPNFGFTLDDRQSDIAYPHWSLLTAATIPGGFSIVRDRLIKPVYKQAYMPKNEFPLPVRYKASTGEPVPDFGSGSAIQGAAFGMLALSLPNVDIKAETIGPSGSSGKTNVSAIVGGVVGGMTFLLFVGAILFFLWRKRKQQKTLEPIDDQYSEPRPFTTERVVPYNPNPSGSSGLSQSQRHASAGVTGREGVSRPLRGLDADPTPMSLTTGVTPPVAMSNKQREALNRRNQGPPHGHNPTPSVSTQSDPYSASAPGTGDLRAEMDQLRREMESIRNITEPPPEYT